MKYILLLISVVSLLATSGCIYPGHHEGREYHGHQEYGGHPEYRSYGEPGVNVRIHAE